MSDSPSLKRKVSARLGLVDREFDFGASTPVMANSKRDAPVRAGEDAQRPTHRIVRRGSSGVTTAQRGAWECETIGLCRGCAGVAEKYKSGSGNVWCPEPTA